MWELLETAERVQKSWSSLLEETEDTERASDRLAELDVQVFVLGRKCDSVTNQLEALNELLPDDATPIVEAARTAQRHRR